MTRQDPKTTKINRREFGGLAIGSLVSIAFGQTLLTACERNKAVAEATPRIIASKAAPIVKYWAVEMHEICSDSYNFV